MTDAPMADLERALEYYRKQADEVAGENLRLDYTISSLQHELKQKKLGFSAISALHRDVGGERDIESIFAVTLYTINSVLGMDKTVVLTPAEELDHYSASQWSGSLEDAARRFENERFHFPSTFAADTGHLIVNKRTPPTPLVAALQRAFDLPHFIALPVVVAGEPLGILISGRMKEAKPLFPPLDAGDLETFEAIVGLISSLVENMRVATLEESNRLQRDFFANMSHEFRTPITLTLGPLRQLAQHRYGELTDAAHEQLAVIRRNQESLLRLVNAILDLAKVEAGGMELHATEIADFNEFLARRIALFQSVAEDQGTELILRLDARASDYAVYLDAEKFETVIVNLMSNAVKFTTAGSIVVETAVTGESLTISVGDSGPGISEADLPHIFDRFRQADGSNSGGRMGTGIGLALVKELVALHGGRISVESEPGRGTAFTVSLPLGSEHRPPGRVSEPEVQRAERAAEREALRLLEWTPTPVHSVREHNERAFASIDPSRRTILYVDDNSDLRRYVLDLLTPEYNVFLEEDGGRGLEFIRAHGPDLVVTDSMMPVLSGPEMIDQLRAYEAEKSMLATPVVMLTARAGIDDHIAGLDTGANDYVTKPFNEDELRARIRTLLRQRQLDEELVDLNETLAQTLKSLELEMERSEALLLNILPEPIAARLKSGENPIVDARDGVTILFADIEKFTELTRRLSANRLVAILNEIFSGFDNLADSFDLEKIKTIGDGYMLAGGLLSDEDQTDAVMRMALEMIGVVRRASTSHDVHLSVRIGIHRGPVIAGVIGQRKFTYDIWGETVNLASRLESNGISNAVQVSETVFRDLSSTYRFESRGEVRMQGIDPVVAYLHVPD